MHLQTTNQTAALIQAQRWPGWLYAFANSHSGRCQQGFAFLAALLEGHALDALRITHKAQLGVHAHNLGLSIQRDGGYAFIDQ